MSKTLKKKRGGTPNSFYSAHSSPSKLSTQNSVTSYYTVEDGEDICPICLDNLTYYRNGRYLPNGSLYTSKCNHTFHFDCAKRHLSMNNRCPVCRTEIDDFIRRDENLENNDIDDLERRLQILLNNDIMINNNDGDNRNAPNDDGDNINDPNDNRFNFDQWQNDIYYQVDGEDAF